SRLRGQESRCIFSSCSSYSLLHDNLSVHPGFVMSGDQASELELAGLRKSPKEFATFCDSEALSVRIIMLHVGKPVHELSVVAVFRDGSKHKLVALRPTVFEDEADVLSLSHSDYRGLELHICLAAIVDHQHAYRPCRFFRIPRFTRRELPMIFV